MYRLFQNEALSLSLFLAFLAFAFAALIAAWITGRQWGDLSSRVRYGEPLTSDERKALVRSRRRCLLWIGVSAISTALSFLMLR